MGVVNITPDSFSDGGQFLQPQDALRQIQKLAEEGADIVDLGAESSRPGASFVDLEEEWRRLAPVLDLFSKADLGIHLSVDTNKPEIMKRLMDYDVAIINDIRGGADDDTLAYLARHKKVYLAMHMHQNPATMQATPLTGEEAVQMVESFYQNTLQRLMKQGFARSDIWLDPGIGFGKDDCGNYKLLQHCLAFSNDWQLVLGVSRKSFLGRTLELSEPKDRDPASKMLEFSFLARGGKAVRTHDVKTLIRIRNYLLQ